MAATFYVLLLFLVGNFFALFPIPLTPQNKALPATGGVFQARPGFPILLLVGESAQGNDFYSSNWGYAWANLLEQEICGCSVQAASMLDPQVLEDTDLLVVTRSAWLDLDSSFLPSIKEWVEDGGVLVTEHAPQWASAVTGLEVVEDLGRSISFPDSVTNLEGQDVDVLMDLPLATRLLIVESISPGCSVLMEMDEEPAVVLRTLARGVVLNCLFDVGMQLTALQQGVPDKGFRVLDKRGAEGVVDATDLVLDDDLLDNPIPYADVLERWLLGVIEDHILVPRIWYFDYALDGVVMITHDEDWFGDPSCFVCREEYDRNYSSTFYVVPKGPMTIGGVENISGYGGDVQVHWNREMDRWFFFFLRGDGSLRSQMDVLEDKKGAVDSVDACRIERLRWGSQYTRPFRIMEAQGIRLDSSLGSAGRTGRGYIHGTGLPFHPVDTNGEVFSLLEIPFQIQAQYSGVNASYIEFLLSESRECYHEAVCALYHPVDIVEGSPAREDWLLFDKIADAQNHGLFTMSQFSDWWRGRSATEIKDVSWEDPVFSFQVKAEVGGLGVMVPERFGELVLSSLDIDGHEIDARKVSLQGKEYFLAPLSLGTQQVYAQFS